MAYHAVVNWKEGMHFEGMIGGRTIHMDAASPSGESQGTSPMGLLLAALGGCTGMDIVHILQKERQDVTGLLIEIDGERAQTNPAVFTHIQILYKVSGRGLKPDAVERAIRLSEERYCSVGIMLGKTAHIQTAFEIEETSQTV